MLCDHPKLTPETVDHRRTGEYVCLTCGKSEHASAWIYRDRAANKRARAAAPAVS